MIKEIIKIIYYITKSTIMGNINTIPLNIINPTILMNLINPINLINPTKLINPVVREDCLICMEKLYDENSDIENQKQRFVQCFRCNVKLHYLCEKRLSQNKHFVQCIQCQSIGTIDPFD